MEMQLPSALVARAAKIRDTLMRDTNGEEDLSLTTIAIKLKNAHQGRLAVQNASEREPAGRRTEMANLAPSFAKTVRLQM